MSAPGRHQSLGNQAARGLESSFRPMGSAVIACEVSRMIGMFPGIGDRSVGIHQLGRGTTDASKDCVCDLGRECRRQCCRDLGNHCGRARD